ncbi:MAG: aspartyl protease family protein [Saprospiraceae bacterium]|nr:aspartyl protease family protein [Saprospiraceae bacterium]
MKRIILSLLLLICLSALSVGQVRDLHISKGQTKVDLPFDFHNNFIIVKVIFNNFFPLKFILDTGAEHTILTKREITDLLRVNYQREFKVLGSDMQTELVAYLASGIRFQLGDLSARNRSILVLQEDYFRFDEFAGIDVHGILGADFLRRFIVKINYRKQIVTLYSPQHFTPPKNRYKELPIEIVRNKPYIYTTASFGADTSLNLKLLYDTGASLAALLYTDTDPGMHLPESVIRSPIAIGLGGFLEGYIGRLPSIQVGPYKLANVVTNYQDLPPTVDSSYTNNRNGIIGNLIMQRFIVIVDYFASKIYLSPTRSFKKKFDYDRSGITLVATGKNLGQYRVLNIITGSPADEAGVQTGDLIRKVNGVPASLLSLGSIINKFQKKEGKRTRVILKRGDEKIKVEFRLRKLI